MSEVEISRRAKAALRRLEREYSRYVSQMTRLGVVRLTVDKRVPKVRLDLDKIVRSRAMEIAKRYCYEGHRLCYDVIRELASQYSLSSIEEFCEKVVRSGRSVLIALAVLRMRGEEELERYLASGEVDESVREAVERQISRSSFFSGVLRLVRDVLRRARAR